jgi:hypothetical protein
LKDDNLNGQHSTKELSFQLKTVFNICVVVLPPHLMVISGLVSRIPDVRQRHRRVEPVEDAEGQGHVLDDGPKFGAVKVLLLQTISV